MPKHYIIYKKDLFKSQIWAVLSSKNLYIFMNMVENEGRLVRKSAVRCLHCKIKNLHNKWSDLSNTAKEVQKTHSIQIPSFSPTILYTRQYGVTFRLNITSNRCMKKCKIDALMLCLNTELLSYCFSYYPKIVINKTPSVRYYF